MKIDKAIKHTARCKAGCPWHRRIKKDAKKTAGKLARRIARKEMS